MRVLSDACIVHCEGVFAAIISGEGRGPNIPGGGLRNRFCVVTPARQRRMTSPLGARRKERSASPQSICDIMTCNEIHTDDERTSNTVICNETHTDDDRKVNCKLIVNVDYVAAVNLSKQNELREHDILTWCARKIGFTYQFDSCLVDNTSQMIIMTLHHSFYVSLEVLR